MVLKVIVGEQHLPDVQLELGKEPLVHGHESRLADGSAGLQFGQVAGPLLQPKHAHPGPDRARGYEHYLLAGLAPLGDLGYQLLHLERVELPPAVG
jgi:hypothetical protein